MAESQKNTTVFIGNLDERVGKKVLYEIMVQAGPVLQLHMPTNLDTKKHKGFAFVQYPSQATAQYAVNLFSGLVCLYNKIVRFEISSKKQFAASATSGSDMVYPTSLQTHRPLVPVPRPPSGRWKSRRFGCCGSLQTVTY